MSKIIRIHDFQHSFTFSSQAEKCDAFCARFLEGDLGAERLDNFKKTSEIRCELAKKLDMDKVQQALYGHWSPHMQDKGCITMDATCYKSHLRYPTNVKLLWEAVNWLHDLIKGVCKELGVPVGLTGKDKEHHHLKRIRARTKETEILWIFFGIHTGNALEIGRRMWATVLEKAT